MQQRVDEFLTGCATQEVLQPTGCPFGFIVEDRIASTPTWSISRAASVEVVPDGANWRIPAADAVAHIEVDIRSLFDGSVRHVSEDVPFLVTGHDHGASGRHRVDRRRAARTRTERMPHPA